MEILLGHTIRYPLIHIQPTDECYVGFWFCTSVYKDKIAMHTPVHGRYIRRSDVVDPAPRHASGPVLLGATVYFEFNVEDDAITSVQFRWFDATTEGTFTGETSNVPYAELASDVAAGSGWFPETLTITSPAGVAVGTYILHMGNNGAKRLRIKYVAIANSEIEVLSWGVH
jgi:hypothetical protein